jgi:hypothetical protein
VNARCGWCFALEKPSHLALRARSLRSASLEGEGRKQLLVSFPFKGKAGMGMVYSRGWSVRFDFARDASYAQRERIRMTIPDGEQSH